MIEALTIDAASTIRLLQSIEALHPMLALIHVFLDNARYHHAKLVQEWLAQPGRRIKLHFIPTYCPHLNPIERLWRLMHRNENLPVAVENKEAEAGSLQAARLEAGGSVNQERGGSTSKDEEYSIQATRGVQADGAGEVAADVVGHRGTPGTWRGALIGCACGLGPQSIEAMLASDKTRLCGQRYERHRGRSGASLGVTMSEIGLLIRAAKLRSSGARRARTTSRPSWSWAAAGKRTEDAGLVGRCWRSTRC